jgi:arylsulfatase A-like enzyme
MKKVNYSTIIAGAIPLLSFSPSTAQKLPNVIFILVDDMGFGDLSLCGQENFSTPNIDKMAQEGLFLSNMYTGSTVSAPSRASLLTGKHTGHTSVRANDLDRILGDDELTIAHIFQSAGYATGAIGKWGLGGIMPNDDPKRKGFDYFYGYVQTGHAHNFYPEFLYENGERVYLNNKTKLINGVNPWLNSRVEGRGIAEIRNDYAPFLFDQKALSFIDEKKDESFFLYLAYNTPHTNNAAKDDGMEVPDYGEFACKDWPNPAKGYAAMMRNLDNSVGMILDKLKQLNLDKNTIVMFCSDNGPHSEGGHSAEFFNSNGIYRGIKRDLYDGGIRTPFIVWGPDIIKPNSRSDQQFAFWDVLPTFVDMLDYKGEIETNGISFYPTLIGKRQKKKHDYLYWEFYEQKGKQAMIKGNWKAVKLNVSDPKEETVFELYNIKKDPEENHNVAKSNPRKVRKFERLLKTARTEFSDMPLFKEDIKE